MLGDSGKMATRDIGDGGEMPDQEFHLMHLEPRPLRHFTTSEEYLLAMKEDLAEWLNNLYGMDITIDDFMEKLETGVVLCRHANSVMRRAREWRSAGHNGLTVQIPERDVVYRTEVQPGTFHARDNVSNFISWCRALAIKECLLFETDDLVLRKNERSFILCLLEVARRGAKFGMPAPLLVQMEQEIDEELAKESSDDYEIISEPPAQIITNDLRSLHERVVELLSRCTCPSQFPMIRVAEGKYRIGDTKVLIFVRILRNHIMVRVGGGWDTLGHYLDKHDPCRCRSGHRVSTSAKLTMQSGKGGTPQMQVTYNRTPPIPYGTNLTVRPSSVPTSPQNRRRSLPSPQPDPRRCSNPDIEYISLDGRDLARVPSRNSHCSDDSSTSSASLQMRSDSPETARRLTDSSACKAPHLIHCVNSTDSSSEHSEGETPSRFSNGHIRKISPRKMIRLGDGVDGEEPQSIPSSWRYSPQTNEFAGGLIRPSEKVLQNGSYAQNTRCRRSSGENSVNSEVKLRVNSRPSSRDTSPVTSRIPTSRSPFRSCDSNNSNKLTYGQKSQSSEDLYRSRSPSNALYGQRSRGSSPLSSPYKSRRTSADSSDYFTRGIRRSRSQASENGDKGFSFDRGGPGRYSYRMPRNPEVRPRVDTGNKTWTFRQRSQRPAATADLFRGPSPKTSPQHSPRKSVDNTNPKSPLRRLSSGKKISPLLEKILTDDDLDSDEKILKKMEVLINQYKTTVEKKLREEQHNTSEGFDSEDNVFLSMERNKSESMECLDRNTSPSRNKQRKDSIGSSPSKIPIPTWQRRD